MVQVRRKEILQLIVLGASNNNVLTFHDICCNLSKDAKLFVIGLHELRRQHLWHKKEIKIHVTVTCQLFNGKNKFLNFFQDFILVLDKRNDFFQFFFQRSKRESREKDNSSHSYYLSSTENHIGTNKDCVRKSFIVVCTLGLLFGSTGNSQVLQYDDFCESSYILFRFCTII